MNSRPCWDTEYFDCDGVDNDCDGTTRDECYAQFERCDREDADLDGEVDEGCPCSLVGERFDCDADCCSGYCNDGTCERYREPDRCLVREPCVRNEDCCSGLCGLDPDADSCRYRCLLD